MKILTRTIVVSVAAFSLCSVALSSAALASDLEPVIYLSPVEAARAKRTAQEFKQAQDHLRRASAAWQIFQERFETAHPELLHPRFTTDFRFAIGGATTPTPFNELPSVELSAEERKKAEFLHLDLVDAKKALDQAKSNWYDYQFELVSDHFPNPKGGQVSSLKNGKRVVIPTPWNYGVAFTQGFRVGVPRP